MKLIQGSMILRTGIYQAMRNAAGTAVRKPKPKPAAMEVKLLNRSDQNAPRSIMVWSPSITTGIKGKLFPVRLPRESKYQTTSAAQNESNSQSLSLIPFFFVFPFI